MSEAAFLESSEIAVLGKSQAASLEASKMAFPGASEAASICLSVVIVICDQNSDPIKFEGGPAGTCSNSFIAFVHSGIVCGIGYGALNNVSLPSLSKWHCENNWNNDQGV